MRLVAMAMIVFLTTGVAGQGGGRPTPGVESAMRIGPERTRADLCVLPGPEHGDVPMKWRTGTRTATLIPWTPSAALVRQGGEENARNILSVEVWPGSLTFFVNGEPAARVAREGIETDGIVGLRVNHGLTLHVTSLEVT